jgi:choline dehydrogenase-like flavoprotein
LPQLLTTGLQISDGLWKTLELLTEVMLPSPLPADGPSIGNVVDGIVRFLDNGSGPLIQAVRIALQIISLLLPILDLKPDKIRPKVSAILDDESNSLIRQGLIAIHQVVIFAYYADDNADGMLGYARPSHIPSHRTAFRAADTIPDRTFDVVIAGTGPAGTLLADRLSASGKSVLLLEAGPYIAEQNITPNELDSIARLYKSSGLQSASDSPITVLQGGCVGGGGVVNNGIFFRLPPARLAAWQNAGFPFDGGTLDAAYRRIAGQLNIGDIWQKANQLNPAGGFLVGSLGGIQAPSLDPLDPGFYRFLVNLETLGPDTDKQGCRSTGLCNLGCGSERKVNSFQYYLRNALSEGRDVTLVHRATVLEAVMGDGATARSVIALKVRLADGRTALARGNSFVLSCGPVGSSGVLLRSADLLSAAASGLPVGKRFCANVASPVLGVAPLQVNVETYVQMCHVFVPDDGSFLIETWFNPPGGLALAMAGFLDSHAARMRQYPSLVGASAVVGTHPLGVISLSRGDTAISLPLAACDIDNFRRGTIRLLSAMIENQVVPVFIRFGKGRTVANQADIEALDLEMRELTPADLHLLPMSTAHPQGGNALSLDPAIGVVGEDFRVRGIDNLRVCDGSVFPAVAGVNPQWTIYALADLCASTFD